MDISPQYAGMVIYSLQPLLETAGVYTVVALKGETQIPIYVGESTNVRRRIGEYIVSAFAASTDFIVGEAIKFLQSEGFRIEVHVLPFHGNDKSRRLKQNAIIQECIDRGFVLLNRNANRSGYDYRKSNASTERTKIIEMVQQEILKHF